MSDKINGRTPEEIRKGLECCINWETGCIKCPYDNLPPDECVVAMKSNNLAYIQQLERERDAAVETVMLLANADCTIPCESDELACSEYCEKHCNFRAAQKECWLEYLRRRVVQEVE